MSEPTREQWEAARDRLGRFKASFNPAVPGGRYAIRDIDLAVIAIERQIETAPKDKQ